MSQKPTDTELLNLIIEEMRYKEWMDMFPLFRPMTVYPDGSYEYTEKYINPDTFRQHITDAYIRWESKK